MLLDGKTALITGCLKGIGYEAMQGFARQGASIVACCQFHDPLFEERARQLAAETGVGITPVVFDLASTDETLTAMRELVVARRRIDILLNIAGMTQDAPSSMTAMKSMRRVFEINFFALCWSRNM